MGFLRHRDDPPDGRRFQMREKLASIGDDSWIEDDQGQRVYKVDGKALRVRNTFILKDSDGNEVAKIQEKKLRVRDTMQVAKVRMVDLDALPSVAGAFPALFFPIQGARNSAGESTELLGVLEATRLILQLDVFALAERRVANFLDDVT